MRRLATGLLPRSCLLRLVASEGGQGVCRHAGGPARRRGRGSTRVTAEPWEPVSGGPLNIESAPLRLSESRATQQRRRSCSPARGGGQAPRQRDVLARWFGVAARGRAVGEVRPVPGRVLPQVA